MKTPFKNQRLSAWLSTILLAGILDPGAASGVTNVFFDVRQGTNVVASGTTSETIGSQGYLFTLTRDNLFTGGVGLTNPIGRSLRVHWPAGLEAQAVTAGPRPGPARIEIKRQDGEPFAIQAFTAKLLANTAGAGAAFEIMPMLNGEDGVADPFTYDATGVAGNQFAYSTSLLSGYDAYKITLYVDFALVRLTVVDASSPPPALNIVSLDATTLELSWPSDALGFALESATNLPAPVWSPVTNAIVVDGDRFAVTMEPSGSHRFYRLRK